MANIPTLWGCRQVLILFSLPGTDVPGYHMPSLRDLIPPFLA